MTYTTEFTRPGRGPARVVVLAAGLVAQAAFTLAFGHDSYSKGITLLTVAVGLVAWLGPMLACRATWYRVFAVTWFVTCGLFGFWFLPFTFIVLLATLASIATPRPDPGAVRGLGMVVATVAVVVVGYVGVVVPTQPADLRVCLEPGAPNEHFHAVFDVAMPDGDPDPFSISSAAQGREAVHIEFDDWATDDEIGRLVDEVSQLPSVTGTSREGCPST